MSRGVSTDKLGLAGTELKITNYAENASINTAEGMDERGDIIARETYESLTAPSSDYTICTDYDIAGIVMGTLVDQLTDPDLIITGFTVSTAGGSAPTVSVTSESVPTGSAQGVTYTTPTFTVASDHDAQILFSAYTLAGDGCYTQSCSATGQCTLSRGLNEDGETCSFDVNGATIEVTAEINMTDTTAPTITPAANWTVTSPATPTEVNTDYTTYSVTLRYTPVTVEPA